MKEFNETEWTGCCHVYSYGEDTPKLMTSRADFIKAVQIVSYCSTLFKLEVLAFVLMDTHFHFVLKGGPAICQEFGGKVMKLLLLYINRSRKRKCYFPSSVLVSTKEILGSRYLKTVICYVLRNPVDAGFRQGPSEYEWSSARLYFSGHHPSGRRISDLKYRERLAKMGAYRYPATWTVSEEGIVDYENFVSYKTVENIFGGVRGILAFMAIKKSDVEELNYSCEKESLGQVSDSELYQLAAEMVSVLHWPKVEHMDNRQKLMLAQRLRGKRGCGKKQLARVLGINIDLAERVLT